MTIYTINQMNRHMFTSDVAKEIGDREFVIEFGRVVPLEGDLTDIYLDAEIIQQLNNN